MRTWNLLKQTAVFVTALALLGSCSRSYQEAWDDSKTASRHMGRGMCALGGKQGDSQLIANHEQFMGRPTRQDFIPLGDETAYRQLTLGDVSALESLEQEVAALPQPKESPGDPGSSVPGIQEFSDPARDAQLGRIFKNIKFPYNSSVVKGDESLKTLHAIKDYLLRHPETYLFIEGHCDERGPQAYNLSLGTRRANSLRNFLIGQGVDLERLFTISYGKERPIVKGHDESSWQTNRRGQFKLFQKAG